MIPTAEIKCLHSEVWPIERFVENPKNPNRHPQSQIAQLAQIIKTRGWRAPIVVSSLSGMVVKGHGRLRAARHAGLATCPVEVQEYATPAEEMADMVADNRIAELADNDDLMLAGLLTDLNADELGTSAAGYTEADFQALVKTVETEKTGSRTSGDTVFQYNVIFGSELHQQQWFAFLKKLKSDSPGSRTVGESLSAFIEKTMKA